MAKEIKLTVKDKEQIARIMGGLNCSYEEALEIHLCDKAIDRGEHMDFDNIEVVNAERQVKFTIGEDIFELTLVQKRRPKN